MNEFGLFQSIYLGHFSHNFHSQGVRLKGKVLAAKWIFQNYLQLLDNFTWLVLKTAKKFFVSSVFSCTKERELSLAFSVTSCNTLSSWTPLKSISSWNYFFRPFYVQYRKRYCTHPLALPRSGDAASASSPRAEMRSGRRISASRICKRMCAVSQAVLQEIRSFLKYLLLEP